MCDLSHSEGRVGFVNAIDHKESTFSEEPNGWVLCVLDISYFISTSNESGTVQHAPS